MSNWEIVLETTSEWCDCHIWVKAVIKRDLDRVGSSQHKSVMDLLEQVQRSVTKMVRDLEHFL